ncbi:MAG: DUF11 domain-containing protein, partial [Acidimicrobiia bacterium]|nr:DUF11 domain-containing protein [Acidimicrobiia bacterium]
TIPPVVDIELVKDVSVGVVLLGQSTTFTIFATNNGPANATGVVVHDRIPVGLQYVSDSGAGAVVATVPATGGGGTLVWTIGNLAAGASTNFSFVATPLDVGVNYVNVAEVMAHNETDIDSTPGNNVLAEDDQDDAAVIAQAVLQTATTTTTTTIPVAVVTLPKTGIDGSQATGIGAVGLALLLLGGTLVSETRRRLPGRHR